jgi:hypothetical protein
MAWVGRYFAIVVAAALAGCGGQSATDERAGGAECEDRGDCESGGGGTGARAGAGATAGAGAGTSAGGAGGGSGAGMTAGGAGAGFGGAAGAAGSSFEKLGVCGERGEAIASTTKFSGAGEMYLFSAEEVEAGMLESPICSVTFGFERVGDAPPGCADDLGGACDWAHLVELRNPRIARDVDGVCERHELALGAEQVAALDGSRVAYGYVPQYAGHTDVLMRYDPEGAAWFPWAAAFHDIGTGVVTFDARFGVCGY